MPRKMPLVTTQDRFTEAATRLFHATETRSEREQIERIALILRALDNLVADVDDVDNGVAKEVSGVTLSIARSAAANAMVA